MIGWSTKELHLSAPIKPALQYDIAIVGAGAAGLELARMASRAGMSVALIEQGVGTGRHVFQRVPLLVGKIIGNPKFVNAWTSLPLARAGGTTRPVLAGQGLGGSSRVNGNVAYAGHADRYAQVFGPLGLDFSEVLKGLERSAGHPIPHEQTWTDGLTDSFMKAAVTKGAVRVDDPDTDFFGVSPLHVNTRRGLRYNHLEGYLKTHDPKRITLYREAVQRVMARGSVVDGVQLANGTVISALHVVLSAGAIGSPQVLLQSGIGDAAMLEAAGIDTLLDQPQVGQHLKDHANLRIPFSCPAFDTLNQKTRGLKALGEGIKYILGSKDSVLRGPGASAGVNVNGDNPYRIQLVHFTQDRSKVGTDGIVFERQQGASLGMYPLWPHSEGSVQIGKDGLRIDPGFLADDRDVATTQTALNHARKLIAQMGFSPRKSDQDDEVMIRSGVYSGYHLIGSNRMAVDASNGVVAPNFAVHGLDGLSVCDASVMPDHLSSHSYLATIAMARMFGAQRGWI